MPTNGDRGRALARLREIRLPSESEVRTRLRDAAAHLRASTRDRWIGRRIRAVVATGPAATVLVGVIAVGLVAVVGFRGADAYSYWTYHLDADPYAAPANAWGALNLSHPYPPVFAQLIGPLQVLPYPAFLAVWTAIAYGAFVAVVGVRWAGLALLCVPAIVWEISAANVTMLYGVVAVFGRRWPALWAVPLLTKVSPGIGVVWFAARREWRQLMIGLGISAALVAASLAVVPDAWQAWLEWLSGQTLSAFSDISVMAFPLGLRIAGAAVMVAWGARTERPWVLPVAMWLSMPIPWNHVFLLSALLAARMWWTDGSFGDGWGRTDPQAVDGPQR